MLPEDTIVELIMNCKPNYIQNKHNNNGKQCYLRSIFHKLLKNWIFRVVEKTTNLERLLMKLRHFSRLPVARVPKSEHGYKLRDKTGPTRKISNSLCVWIFRLNQLRSVPVRPNQYHKIKYTGSQILLLRSQIETHQGHHEE